MDLPPRTGIDGTLFFVLGHTSTGIIFTLKTREQEMMEGMVERSITLGVRVH